MMKLLLVLTVAMIPVGALCQKPAPPGPIIRISPSVSTVTGAPRVFQSAKGTTKWSPSLPVYRGDMLTTVFDIEGGFSPTVVKADLDNEPLSELKTAPWRVEIDTSRLSPGKHVLRGDVRFGTNPITYSIAELPFYVQEPPLQVKGTVQEVLDPDYPAKPEDSLTQPHLSINAPQPKLTDPKMEITLKSSDSAVETALRSGNKISISSPVVFRVDARPGIDRWVYKILRNGLPVTVTGPVSRLVHLEIVPKLGNEPGLLPGDLLLKVWGVRNDGVYSAPVEIPLTIEQKG